MMDHLQSLLLEHYVNHPDMEIQDGAKFIYQSHLGGGHLISNEDVALARLVEEWENTPADCNQPLVESLGNSFCRINLSACKGIGLSTKTVYRLFLLSAKTMGGDRETMNQDLELIRTLPFLPHEVDTFLTEYRGGDLPMLRHSQAYRDRYSPAYRVIQSSYVNLIPLLCAIDKAMAEHPQVLLAIDGPCASGKSTLGARLEDIYTCPLIHMDDFFLTPDLRSKERLSQPGGNVDYARFDAQVLTPLANGTSATFAPYRCQSGTFGDVITVNPSPLVVIEGVYSMRPDLRARYQLGVWVEAEWETRKKRLLERGGPEGLSRYEQRWIPMENQYFQACGVKDSCQITVSGEDETE